MEESRVGACVFVHMRSDKVARQYTYPVPPGEGVIEGDKVWYDSYLLHTELLTPSTLTVMSVFATGDMHLGAPANTSTTSCVPPANLRAEESVFPISFEKSEREEA